MVPEPAMATEVSGLSGRLVAEHRLDLEKFLEAVLVPLAHQDGPEDLLARDGHLGPYAGEHGRPHVIAVAESLGSAGPARDQHRAFPNAGLDELLDLVEL